MNVTGSVLLACVLVLLSFPSGDSFVSKGGDFVQRGFRFRLYDTRRPKIKNKKTKRTPAPKRKAAVAKSGGKGNTKSHPHGNMHSGKDHGHEEIEPPFGVGVAMSNQPPPTAKTKSVTKSVNILGQNVVQCRDFSISSPKIANFIGSYPSVDQMPIFSIPELAFLGRSNVGKSSLFNSLIGTKVAVSSKTPGRTQGLNTFTCKDKEGDISVMVDLPGYGYAKLSKEKQDAISDFIQRYLVERKSLRLVVLLVDCRREAQEYERGVLEFLRAEGLQYIVVATKIDKMKKNEADAAIQSYKRKLGLYNDQIVKFSAITGEGRRNLWAKIRDGLTGTVSKAFAEMENEEDDDEYDIDEIGWDHKA